MNRKQDMTVEDRAQNGEYALHRNCIFSIVAGAVALLVAVIVWIVVMNGEDTAFVEMRVLAAPEDYEYTLSQSELELTGRRADLRRAKEIGVIIPDRTTNTGVYTLNEEDLVLPEGTELTAPAEFTMTVRAK